MTRAVAARGLIYGPHQLLCRLLLEPITSAPVAAGIGHIGQEGQDMAVRTFYCYCDSADALAVLVWVTQRR